MLQVALRIPSGLDRLTPSDAAAQIGVSVVSEPRSEVMEPRASFDAIDGRIDSQETMPQWLGSLTFFGDAGRVQVLVMLREAPKLSNEFDDPRAVLPRLDWEKAQFARSPAI